MIKNNSGKRKGLLVVLSASMLLVSSIAFFTDRKSNASKGALGNLYISTLLGSNDLLPNLAPGDVVPLDYSVANEGSLDGVVRTSYTVAVPEDEIGDYSLDDLQLAVDGDVLVSKVNTIVRGTPFNLGSGEVRDGVVELRVSPQLLNKAQSLNLKVEILSEIKQINSPEWVELETQSIVFGNDLDFKVVPSTDMLQTDVLDISRGSTDDAGVQGYVITNRYMSSLPTVDEYKKLFKNDVDSVKVHNKDGVEMLVGSELVLPGSIVSLYKGLEVVDRLEVVLRGDLNGDGYIIASDLVISKSLMLASRGYSGVSLPTKHQVVAGDIDGDGLLSINDTMMLRALTLDYSSLLPVEYPSTPKLSEKPKLGLSVGDNSYVGMDLSDERAWSIGDEFKSGDSVAAGQIIRLSVDLNDLRGLDVSSLQTWINFNKDYVEVVDVDTLANTPFILKADQPGVGGVLPGGVSWDGRFKTDWGSEAVVDYNSDVGVIDFGIDMRMVNSTGLVDQEVLSKLGSFGQVALRVKDDVPSGTVLNFSLEKQNFSFISDNLSFYDEISQSSAFNLVVR